MHQCVSLSQSVSHSVSSLRCLVATTIFNRSISLFECVCSIQIPVKKAHTHKCKKKKRRKIKKTFTGLDFLLLIYIAFARSHYEPSSLLVSCLYFHCCRHRHFCCCNFFLFELAVKICFGMPKTETTTAYTCTTHARTLAQTHINHAKRVSSVSVDEKYTSTKSEKSKPASLPPFPSPLNGFWRIHVLK